MIYIVSGESLFQKRIIGIPLYIYVTKSTNKRVSAGVGAPRVAYIREKQKLFFCRKKISYPVITVACFWKSLQERSMAKKYLLKDESGELIPKREEECSRVRRNSFMSASNQDVWILRGRRRVPFLFTKS